MDKRDGVVGDQADHQQVTADQQGELEMPVAELAALGFQQNESPESAAASRLIGQLIYDLSPENCPDKEPVQLVVEAASHLRRFGQIPPPGKSVRFYFKTSRPFAEISREAVAIARGELPLRHISDYLYHCDTCVAPEELVPAIRAAMTVLKETLSRRRSVTEATVRLRD